MNANAPISDTIYEAFLHCETKAYLLLEGATGVSSEIGDWQRTLGNDFKQSASEQLRSNVPAGEYYVGTPPRGALEQGLYRVIVDPLFEFTDIRTRLHALSRDVVGAVYSPVRFVRSEKVATSDKLLVAFDALIVFRATGKMPRVGKIIHGSQYETVAIPLPKLVEKAKSIVFEIVAKQENATQPPLVLNKHCPACEFQSRCRQLAIEKDDLSLLANMTEKGRKQQNGKGIFTVTQLSYTFRPRRHSVRKLPPGVKHESALKALAIRKNRIHVLGMPTFAVPRGAVYLDVEGIPDLDFYYLIGLRYRRGDEDIQHSFWADSPSDERDIWGLCLLTLALIEAPRVIHYGSYEKQFLKRMKARYCDAAEDVRFLDQVISTSFNLLSLTYAQVYFPTYSNGLKEISRQLGFQWSETTASGLNSLVWRSQWEASREPRLKQKLLTYNAEDCEAVQRLAETIATLCSEQPAISSNAVSINVNSLERAYPRRFGVLHYAVPDFKPINEAAYWDYQRNKVYLRTSKRLKRVLRQAQRCDIGEGPPINKLIEVQEERQTHCPQCGSRKLYKNGRFSRVVYDLRFSRAGIKRWIVKYSFNRYICRTCKNGFNEFPRQEKYGKGLKAYVLYQVVELRISQRAVARSLNALFGFRLSAMSVNSVKISSARQYQDTYQNILDRIVAGTLVHADETKVTVGGESQYVWVFTNLEDVAYVYSKSREAGMAQEILKTFKGVLVSDFYTGYDSIDCAQQKCLIHRKRPVLAVCTKCEQSKMMAFVGTDTCVHKEESWTHRIKNFR